MRTFNSMMVHNWISILDSSYSLETGTLTLAPMYLIGRQPPLVGSAYARLVYLYQSTHHVDNIIVLYDSIENSTFRHSLFNSS